MRGSRKHSANHSMQNSALATAVSPQAFPALLTPCRPRLRQQQEASRTRASGATCRSKAASTGVGQADPADQERLLDRAADHRRDGDGVLSASAADDGRAAARRGAAVARQHAEGAVAARRVPGQRGRRRATHRHSRRCSPRCKKANAEFEKNYDLLLDTHRRRPAVARPRSIRIRSRACCSPSRSISTTSRPSLAANGWRFISARRDRARHRQARRRLSRRQANAPVSTRPSPTRRLPATRRSASASGAIANARLDKHAQRCTGRCSSPPSASSSWSRCSSSGRCPT